MALTPTRRGVRLPDAGVGTQGVRRGCWALLSALLAANLGGAAAFDPPAGRPLPGDGATHVLQAASLAFDLDLAWSRSDLERFVAHRGRAPERVVLRSPDRGERITFGTPVPWALAAAPFVRVSPVRGPAVANALFLALAAVAAAATLERRLGPTAPLWVASFTFASVAFVYTFRPTPELFAACLVALAFAVAYRGEGRPALRFTEIFAGSLPGEGAGRGLGRWIGVGALAATAGAFHPFYLVLLVPLALAAPPGRRRAGGAVLLVAAVAVLAAWGGLGALVGGGWLPWDRGGRLFTPETGFPGVDLPASLWPAVEGGLDWLPGGPPEEVLDARLLGWSALFLAAGRHVGLLPYFLPLVLGFAAFNGERGRSAIPLAVGSAVAGLALVRPFDLAGSADPVAAAFFLPLYPALWFLAARPLGPGWVFAVAILAAPFLYPAWLSPTGVAAGEPYASPVAARILPFETTQSSLPGVEEIHHGPLWLRLEPGGVAEGPGGSLRVRGGRTGGLWIGSAVALPAVRLEVAPGGPTQVELAGAELLRTVLTPDGGVVFVLDPGEPDRRHRVAWSTGPYAFYHLGVSFPGGEPASPVAFRIVPLFGGPGEP
ncbi:MAG TPA: hypothetical protein VMR44_06625 [Thermoanaerobaculia bacterium]|nr:hypothetical protein [Thermoanaerobaculia bacterium]